MRGNFAWSETMDLALFVAILYHRHMSEFLGTWDDKEHKRISQLLTNPKIQDTKTAQF
ncbi:hypothetical protein SARC_16935, partial [Sphaeroforma arctica JP610]